MCSAKCSAFAAWSLKSLLHASQKYCDADPLNFYLQQEKKSFTHVFFSTGPSPSFKTAPHKLPAFDRFLKRAKAAI